MKERRPQKHWKMGAGAQARFETAKARLAAFRAYALGPKDLTGATAPVFVGATGGSGTRVVVRLAQHAGYFIGTNLHRSMDSLDLDRFCASWLHRHLADGTLSPSAQTAMDKQLERALIWHRSKIPATDRPWLLKHPRTVLMLAYLQARCPAMRFLHVVRDGRDMAFARNLRQLDLYGDVVLPRIGLDTALHEKAMRFWAATNLRAKEFAETNLDGRYLQIRFEDLCAHPRAETGRLFEWLGAPAAGAAHASDEIEVPGTLGRWQQQDPSVVANVTAVGAVALRAFGYIGAREPGDQTG